MSTLYLLRFILPSPQAFSGFGCIYTRFSARYVQVLSFSWSGTGTACRYAARIAFANGIRSGYDNIYVTNKYNNHVRI